MTATMVKKIVVQEGGHIEIDSPGLKPGIQVEVLVFPEPQGPKISLEKLVATGKGCYGTPKEADSYLYRLRKEWES